MVSTIGPLVKVAKAVWARCILALVVASTLAAAAFGAAMGLLGSIMVPNAAVFPPALIGVAALTFSLIELRVVPLSPPSCARSVPQEWWRRLPPTYAAFAYGAVLGIGVTTVIPFAAFYFVLFVALLAGPAGGALILGSYGFGRALPVLAGSLALWRGLDVLDVSEWPIAKGREARMACAAVLIAVACILLVYPLLGTAHV